jgi:hypothetical protein
MKNTESGGAMMYRSKTILIMLLSIVMVGLFTGAVSATDVHAGFDVLAGEVDVDVTNAASFSNFNGQGSFIGDVWIVSDGDFLDTQINVDSHSTAELAFIAANALSDATGNEFYVSLYTGGGGAVGMHSAFDGDITDPSLIRWLDELVTATGTSNGEDGWGFLVSMEAEIRDKEDPENVSAGASVQLLGDGSGSIDHETTMFFSSAATGKSAGDELSVGDTSLLIVNAAGPGEYHQSGYGESSLYYNGMNMPGGGQMDTSGTFNDGFSYNPEIIGK